MNLDKDKLYLEKWIQDEKMASDQLAILNRLRNKGVLIHIFGRSIANVKNTDVLKAHRHARQIIGRELEVSETMPFLMGMPRFLSPCRLDLGKIAVRFQGNRGKESEVYEYLLACLKPALHGRKTVLDKPQDLVIYGFGRIGRLLLRVMVGKIGNGDKILPRAIVLRKMDLKELKKRAAMLRLDSIHGSFDGTIQVDEEEMGIVVNGCLIRFIAADDPSKIDYTAYGINDAILVDSTGKWRDRAGLSKHLESKGIKSVILTAPGKGDIPNIVFGVNHLTLDPEEKIVSAASCTTNAIVPIFRVIEDEYGITSGHIETCHAYTNDQNLIDNYHKEPRRGRAAALNMVLTTTGAAKAVAKVMPEMAGKLTGNAIRVPTPDVSIAILKLTLNKEAAVAGLNSLLQKAALEGPLRNQIDFTTTEDAVSSDFIGSRHACIVDSTATIVNEADPRNVVLYIWYDNEFGYACQLMRLIQQIAGINDALIELPE